MKKAIRDAIYTNITKDESDVLWQKLLTKSPEFVHEHPDLFLDLTNCQTISESEKVRLTEKFYDRSLQEEDIREHPELMEVLKDKNLKVAMSKRFNQAISHETGYIQQASPKITRVLLDTIGNENYLKLCSKYGRYLMGSEDLYGTYIINENTEITPETLENLDKAIQGRLIKECFHGNYPYDMDAPTFLKEKCPQLFLPSDAPERLTR